MMLLICRRNVDKTEICRVMSKLAPYCCKYTKPSDLESIQDMDGNKHN